MSRKHLIILLMISVFGLGWWAWQNRWSLPLLRHQFNPVQTILVVGLDAGERADAILLCYFGQQGTRVLVLPRDTYCSGGVKLNAQFKRLGAERFTELCEQIVAHEIDGYFVIPLERLEGFLHRCFPDGLVVDVPYRLRYEDRAARFSYDIAPGRRRLSSEQLVWYLRDRHSDPRGRGEAARVSRWKTFLRAAFQQLQSPSALSRLPAIARDARQTFPTNLSPVQVAFFATRVRETRELSVAYLPGRPVRVGGVSFFQLDKQAVRQQARLARAGILVPEGLVVQVLNGTSTPLLARRTAVHLERTFGVECIPGNAPSASETRTTVSYTPDSLELLARAIADELVPPAQVQVSEQRYHRPTLIVTLGSDYLSTASGERR
jgi:anionic cell wall polymer biosynthesis LytR-Cps2A-Psr (LCP) family protein